MPTSKHTQSQTQKMSSSSELAYESLPGVFDEALSDSGEVRSHWSYLLDSLNSLGADNLAQRQIKTQRILRDDGATYKPYSDQERTWQVDSVPLLLDSSTWHEIETGLLQRAELFNRLLKDIYGPQELIHQGVIPPEAVFAHPGFLRPCFGIPHSSEQALVLHSVDMVRTSDNKVCVIGDRTQSPSGAGYALENRIVMTRVFPSLFRDSQVHRLAMFFQALRHKLNSLAPEGELPNIVVLTPGSRSESYFEHAYLANYLGYSLVQGRDLIVRNGCVWTKSLSGLSRVDVILRRVDDFYCDPAELKSDSYLGVPGLLEVIRSGKVVVANPLGSGILESPVFLKYLSAISQALIGQELKLPSATTWWAGDSNDREYILDNITHLIIKPVFKRFGQQSVLGSELSANEIEHLRQEIKQYPLKYVAQEFIKPGYSPSLDAQQFVPRPTVLRSFVVAGENSYSAMPGGLTRVGKTKNDHLITNQLSALSKDTWILASEPEKQISLWSDKAGHISISEDQQQDLPSRVIENMFWLGRYAVRAEYALRLLRTVFMQLNNTHHLSEKSYKTILLAVTQVTETFPGFSATDSVLFENPEAELLSVIIDADRPGSVVSSLNELLNCAEEVKVLLSADTQRVINDIRDNVNYLESSIRNDFASAPEEALDPLVTSLLALSGLVHESMIRGYGWQFTEIGRNLERSYQTMSLLRALLVPSLQEYDEDSVLETVLLTLETLITYRRRYRARTDVVNGLELTLLDDRNPRSLCYLLKELKDHIDGLPQRQKNNFLTKEKRTILELLNRIQLAQPENLSAINKDEKERSSLDQLLEECQSLLNELATVLSDIYFDHTETHQQVMAASWEDEL
ncbi:MAG: circularly permuted type 2 ATP-grasp protein [Cellvibrionaceae bacterium]